MKGTVTLRAGFTAALMIVFLILSFQDVDIPEIFHILSGIDYWLLIWAIPLLVASHALRALRWRMILSSAGFDISLGHLFSALMAGYAINNVLPRAGELYRPYAISRLDGVSYPTALATVMLERILDGISFLAVLALVPIVYAGLLWSKVPWLKTVLLQTGAALSAVTVGLVLLFIYRDRVSGALGSGVSRWSSKISLKISRVTGSFLAGLAMVRRGHSYPGILALSILIWGSYILLMYLSFVACGMAGEYSLGVGAAIVVQSFSCVGILIPVPGSTGSYHFFVIQALTVLYSVDVDVAGGYAIITHAVGFITATVIGSYCFFRLGTAVSAGPIRGMPGGSPGKNTAEREYSEQTASR